MAVEVRLPRLSDEMAEATISRWLKEVGESVDQGEPIVEVETDKVIVEVEAPRAGILLEIVAAEQEVVPVDGLLCRIGQPGERPAPHHPTRRPAPEAAAPSGSNVVSMPPRPAAQEAAPAATPAVRVATTRGGPAAPVAASPLARRVAEELGIDLTGVPGTGIGGKVVMADLQPYLPAGPAAASSAPAATAPARAAAAAPLQARPAATRQAPAGRPGGTVDEEVPHSSLRRTIARRMSEAKPGIPHFYLTAEVDVTDLLAMRERLNAAQQELHVSVTDFLIRVAALALQRVPALNATYTEDAVRRSAAVHIGIATAIDDGLVTPVLRDCHAKSVGQIAREARVLVERARARKLAAEDLQGGTFTISNLGMYEVVEFSAIINPPQVGILAVARPQQQPVARDGQVVLRTLLRVTLSADHRAVDGVTGAEFLQAFKHTLEHPEQLVL
jgi:pyruvate dehydrogenase E2 component (dihydrolipoamide acetyltransferase)